MLKTRSAENAILCSLILDLKLSIYDFKEVNSGPFDSKHLKESFCLYPEALSRLGVKGRAGGMATITSGAVWDGKIGIVCRAGRVREPN